MLDTEQLAALRGNCPPVLQFCTDRNEWGCFGLDCAAYGATPQEAQRQWQLLTGSDKLARVEER